MTITSLALIGGIVSALSTSTGSMLSLIFYKVERLRKCHLSMDFALGVMLSAVAFSLVGPELISGKNFTKTLSGLLIGCFFIQSLHVIISILNHESKQISKILLISALIFHNFPEGMGAGASLAGMLLHQAIPLQIALSIQNIAEGLLLALLLQGMGYNLFWAITGGIASGFLEMSGAITAGLMLEQTMTLLPFLLSLAGGAMMMSVVLEVKENFSIGRSIQRKQFALGLLIIPITNLFF